jgi:hypothetical protein
MGDRQLRARARSGSGEEQVLRFAEGLAEVGQELVMMIIGEQVSDADDKCDRPLDDAEQGEGGNPAIESQPVR